MRCEICDYDKELGSISHAHGMGHRMDVNFHKRLKGYYCTYCARSILENIYEVSLPDHEQAIEVTPAVPVRAKQ